MCSHLPETLFFCRLKEHFHRQVCNDYLICLPDQGLRHAPGPSPCIQHRACNREASQLK
jgi:hypothetical protein